MRPSSETTIDFLKTTHMFKDKYVLKHFAGSQPNWPNVPPLIMLWKQLLQV